MKSSPVACLLIVAALTSNLPLSAAEAPWSDTVNGLQARLTLIEKPKLHGTRWLVPFMELRNARDLANSMEVACDNRHLKVELVDADGKPLRSGWSLSRSGPTPDPGTIVLPWESSIRLSLECSRWDIPKNATVMIGTDSGAWVLHDSENGKVYLRATLTGEKLQPAWKSWDGIIQTALVRVVWTNGTTLNQASVIAIAKEAVAANDTWADRATYEASREKAGWSVIVWREPRVPGGHRLVVINDLGEVTEYIQGR